MVELGFPRRVILGEPAAEALTGLLEALGARSVLVVTDPGVAGQGFYKEIIRVLRERFEVAEYRGVAPEPGVEFAAEAAKLARGRDAVIAIGGGSAIDVAKAAAVLAKRPSLGLEDIAPFNPLGVELEKPLVVAVPTTAGTGSDASYGIVLAREEPGLGRVKVAVGSYEVIPYATVLDPSLPAGAPARIKVGAAVDALSHALEALASTNSNPFSDALAEKAAVLIFTSAPAAINRGDGEAWARLHSAATMAGMAFSNSGLGLAHAIAHPLGGLLGLHHGTVVGVVLLGVLPLYEEVPGVREKYERLRIVLEEAYGLPKRGSLLEHVKALYGEIGQPTRFRELGVQRDRFVEAAGKAAELALHDPDAAFSPVIPAPEEIRSLILSLY